MHKALLVALGTFTLLLGGCGSAENASTDDEAAAPASKESVFDPMTDTIDRAKAVEDISLQRKEELDQQLREAEDLPNDEFGQ